MIIGDNMKKLNNRGFAISIILYSLIAIAIMTFFLVIAVQRNTKRNNDRMIDAIKEQLNDRFYTSVRPEIWGIENVVYLMTTPATNATACSRNGTNFTHILDKRDNQTYAVTKIGNQCWMAEDLRYTTPTCLSAEWNTTTPHDACRINGGTGSDQNEVKYQWEVANAVCPTGSHLPSDEEWKTLERTLGMSEVEIEKNNDWRGTNEGQKLKAIQYNGTNIVGFNAKLSGYKDWYDGALVHVEARGYWWSSSPSGTSALSRGLYSTNIRVDRSTNSQSFGFSARCLLGQ